MTLSRSSQCEPSHASSTPLFNIQPVNGGAYLGAVSTTNIKSGDTVLLESPLFVLDAPLQSFLYQRTVMAGSGGGGGPTPVEGEEDEQEQREKWEEEHERKFEVEDWMERAIATQLLLKSGQEKRTFWDLAATQPGMDDTPGWNIFTTNAVSTTRDVGGLFLLLSRFNSSCRPNLTRPVWDKSTRTIVLKALHDIPSGTELAWPYLAVGYEFDGIVSRSAQLEHVFGFTCACRGCALEGEERVASEKRCKQLRFARDAQDGERSGLVAIVRRMEALARDEGLWEAADRLQARAEELKEQGGEERI